MILDAPTFSEVYNAFKEFIGESILVAQCGFEFDFALFDRECERNNLKKIENQSLDTKVLYANIHPNLDETFSTDYLLNYYKICGNDVKRHDALGDSILVARILVEILYEYEKEGMDVLDIKKELEIRKFIPKPLK